MLVLASLRKRSPEPSRLHRARAGRSWRRGLVLVAMAACPSTAHASIFKGETLDKVANLMSWVVLVVAPLVGIALFWMVHILPEKIAEKRRHPQAKAIQTLCLLSLAFGGLLWPLAWLWAYSKPVLYKLAYGTDVDESVAHGHGSQTRIRAEEELMLLRQRVAELEGITSASGSRERT